MIKWHLSMQPLNRYRFRQLYETSMHALAVYKRPRASSTRPKRIADTDFRGYLRRHRAVRFILGGKFILSSWASWPYTGYNLKRWSELRPCLSESVRPRTPMYMYYNYHSAARTSIRHLHVTGQVQSSSLRLSLEVRLVQLRMTSAVHKYSSVEPERPRWV